MHLGEAVDPGRVGLADGAERSAVLDHDDQRRAPAWAAATWPRRPWCAGSTDTGVSKTGCEPLTLATTSATTSVGMSCGMIATPPRRATVSAIRRPEIAVMLATTNGSVVPTPSRAAQVDVEP